MPRITSLISDDVRHTLKTLSENLNASKRTANANRTTLLAWGGSDCCSTAVSQVAQSAVIISSVPFKNHSLSSSNTAHVHQILFLELFRWSQMWPACQNKQWNKKINAGTSSKSTRRLVLLKTSDSTSHGHWVEGKQNNWHAAANLRPQGRPVLTWRLPTAREISSSLLFYPVPENTAKKYCLFQTSGEKKTVFFFSCDSRTG